MREVEIMSAFRHANILSLIGIVLKGMYSYYNNYKHKTLATTYHVSYTISSGIVYALAFSVI